MKSKKNWFPRLAAGALVVAALLGMALAAGQQGTQEDPLVTMSYIKDKATPEILAQVDAKIAEREKTLTEQFNALIDGYTKAMEDALAAEGLDSAAFSVVDVPKGKKLIGGIGCEIMLRVGSANCVAPTEPGLIDMTGGGTLSSGKALAVNHLYMVTIADRGITAVTNVKVLVRGDYTIQ